MARVDEVDCGIMISASYNPYYDKEPVVRVMVETSENEICKKCVR